MIVNVCSLVSQSHQRFVTVCSHSVDNTLAKNDKLIQYNLSANNCEVYCTYQSMPQTVYPQVKYLSVLYTYKYKQNYWSIQVQLDQMYFRINSVHVQYL